MANPELDNYIIRRCSKCLEEIPFGRVYENVNGIHTCLNCMTIKNQRPLAPIRPDDCYCENWTIRGCSISCVCKFCCEPTSALVELMQQPNEKLEKLSFSSVPQKSLKDMLRVLNFGAIKHNEQPGEDKWRKVSKREHLDAAFRHYMSYISGEFTDSESGINHLAHAAIRLMFAMET